MRASIFTALLFLLTSGCVYFSPTDETALQFEDDIPMDVRDAMVSGSLMWNRCGAHMIAPEEAVTTTKRILVRMDTMDSAIGAKYRTAHGWIDFNRKELIRPLEEVLHPLIQSSIARMTAHEVGHAYRLDHTSSQLSIMFWMTQATDSDLTEEDKTEWHRVTGLSCTD